MKFKYIFFLTVFLMSCSSKTVINSSFSTINSSIISTHNNETNSSSQDDTKQKELTYQEKLDIYFDQNYINDADFVSYCKNLGVYNEEEIIDNAIYASSSGNGDGSFSSPYSLQNAFDNVKPGQTIYLRGGTYDSNASDGYYLSSQGNENQYITIRPYLNEKVIITNSSSGEEVYGIQIEANACYLIIEGIEIADLKSKCACAFALYGNNQHHIIIRNNNIHHIETSDDKLNKDAGANAILLLGENKNQIHNIVIMNNKVHNNVLGYSEAVSIAGNCEYIYAFENEIKDNTNIGLDFYGNAGYCSVSNLDQPRYCIASNNIVESSICTYAECAAIYVDGARDILLQNNLIKDSQYGIEIGSEEKNDTYPVKNIVVRNNILGANLVTNIRVGGYEKEDTGIVYDTTFINNTLISSSLNNENCSIIIAKVDNITFKNNLLYKANQGDIISTDFNEDYTKNLHFVNNLYYQNNISKEDITFSIFNESIKGIDKFNALILGSDLYHEFTIDKNYYPSDYVKNKAQSDTLLNGYDYYLTKIDEDNFSLGAVN